MIVPVRLLERDRAVRPAARQRRRRIHAATRAPGLVPRARSARGRGDCCGSRSTPLPARGGAETGTAGRHRTARGRVAAPLQTRQHRPHRHLRPGRDDQLATTPSSKISTSIAPLSVSTTATMSPRLHRVAGLLPATRRACRRPCRRRATACGIHGHGRTHPRARPRRSVRGCGSAASSRCFGVGDRHLVAADARDRRVEVVERLLHDARADLGGEAAVRQPSSTIDRAMGPAHRREDRRRRRAAAARAGRSPRPRCRRAASSSAASSALPSAPP